MTTVYTVIGQHRADHGLLLLRGDDNQYYAYTPAGRLAPVQLTAAWALDSDDELPAGASSAAATSASSGFTRRDRGGEVAGHAASVQAAGAWRPLFVLMTVLALIIGSPIGRSDALAHAPALVTAVENVAVHAEPSLDAPIVVELQPGAEVELTGVASGAFLEVSASGQRGWAGADSFNGLINTAPVATNANLTTAPGADGAVLMSIPAGSTVILTGASVDGYVAASFSGMGGWLPASALA